MIDFDKMNEVRYNLMMATGGPAAGGLTVRDVIATSAMAAFLERDDGSTDFAVAEMAYAMADAMLEIRGNTFKDLAKKECSVDEAFGFVE